jgi:prophage DNA circulation protein
VSKPAPVGGHARLVAHHLYGDHTRAAEIERLNSLGRRLLIEPGEVLRVYAR